MRRPLGSFTRKTGRKTHAPIDACRKERPGESDERGVNARRAASCLPACGGTCSRLAVRKAILYVHFCHFRPKWRNGASGTSDMDGNAAKVAARESGDEQVQSLITSEIVRDVSTSLDMTTGCELIARVNIK